eukprot:TRINITY_DN10437_c0_g1_i1.p1 TRINITY_DN10437_c0_g1~~TRINITY_DN10437_c0_g1_i1.p1  ORF type:complete len:145 (-),score=8.86 TRINITY_DN10437_c0_g1_i1:112-546(-)
MHAYLRYMVAKSRRRFQEDGFDLDLSYITQRIIAMSLPSEGGESLYRNPLSQIRNFIQQYHKNQAKIFNLCEEKNYDCSKFNTAYSYYPLEDKQPPPLDITMKFCMEVEEWFLKDDKNVVIVHCKAGKGRTGYLICCLLRFMLR